MPKFVDSAGASFETLEHPTSRLLEPGVGDDGLRSLRSSDPLVLDTVMQANDDSIGIGNLNVGASSWHRR